MSCNYNRYTNHFSLSDMLCRKIFHTSKPVSCSFWKKIQGGEEMLQTIQKLTINKIRYQKYFSIQISSLLVKELREKSGAPMMECKKVI